MNNSQLVPRILSLTSRRALSTTRVAPELDPAMTTSEVPAKAASLTPNTSRSSTSSSLRADTAPVTGGKPMLASQRAKEQQRQTGEQPPARRWFPLGYKESAQQWVSDTTMFRAPDSCLLTRPRQWTSVTAAAAERNVLLHVPILKEAVAGSLPDDDSSLLGQRVWKTQMVHLSGKNRALNEYSVERVGEKADETLVMLHGYGAGLGLFYRNFEPLSRVKGWRLFALDMLGMGNSSRPDWKIHAKTREDKITEAENWFVDSLEEWRRIRGIEKFTLLGHSLGGYLAVSYAIKYPGRLNKLILASPVGIPEDPYAVNAELPDPEDSTIASEFTDDQESIVSRTSSNAKTNPTRGPEKKAAAGKEEPPKRRPLPGWVVWAWDANVSPFSLVRFAGPLGPSLVSGWTSRRFNHLPENERATLHTYAYNLFRQKGSGEYALPYLLAPGAHARRPLIQRIHEVGRQVLPPAAGADDGAPATRECGLPVVFMYGENDWMDVAGGLAAEVRIQRRIEQALAEATPDERRRENGSAKVLVVQKAGHHLYLDNPDDFNKMVQWEMEQTRSFERRRLRQGEAE